MSMSSGLKNSVRRKYEVELWYGVQHCLCSRDDTAVMQERCAVRVCADATHRVGRNESVGKPLLSLQEVILYLVEKRKFTSYRFERVGNILL